MLALYSTSTRHVEAAAKQAKRMGHTEFAMAKKAPSKLPVRLQLYYWAFIQLDTERTDLEQIPWSAIVRYCGHYGLNDDQTETMIYLIRMADNEILADRRKKANQRAKGAHNDNVTRPRKQAKPHSR